MDERLAHEFENAQGANYNNFPSLRSVFLLSQQLWPMG